MCSDFWISLLFHNGGSFVGLFCSYGHRARSTVPRTTYYYTTTSGNSFECVSRGRGGNDGLDTTSHNTQGYCATIITFCKSPLKHYHNAVLITAKATRTALRSIILFFTISVVFIFVTYWRITWSSHTNS